MQINFTDERHLAKGVKMVIYGHQGSGKTPLLATLDNVLVLDAEDGLLSLQGSHTPYISIKSIEDMDKVLNWLQTSEEAKKFKTIAIDSASEISEFVYAEIKDNHKNKMQAYGELAEICLAWFRALLALDQFNIIFTAKEGIVGSEDIGQKQGVIFEGKKLRETFPYLFDEILQLAHHTDADGNQKKFLKTFVDGKSYCRDRSGKLSPWEPAESLQAIINKIQS